MTRLAALPIAFGVLAATTACDVPRPMLDGGARDEVDSGVRCLALPPVLEFGEVEVGQRRTMTLRLTNPLSVRNSVQFTSVVAPFSSTLNELDGGMVFSPRGSRDVEFVFIPPDGRLHLSHFQFTGGEGCTTQDVTLTGLGAGRIDAAPRLRFPPVDLGTSVTVPLRVFNSRRASTTINTLTVLVEGTGRFSAPQNVQLAAASSIDLPITFVSDGFEGPNSARLVLRGERGDRVEVSLEAMSGVPIIEVSPRRIESDHLGMTESAIRTIFVRNIGRGGLLIEGVTINAVPPALATEVTVLAHAAFISPGEVGVFTVGLLPLTVGHREWEVRLESNDPVTPELGVTIVAEVARRFACGDALRAPAMVNTTPPYPRQVEVAFENLTAGECIADGVHFDGFTSWTLDLGVKDTFVVPPMSTVRRVVTITEPGEALLSWRTYTSPLGGTTLIASP